jgi:5'(3')-deoxyribonucleotidase
MRIFLDVDGVLADWVGSVHRAIGIPYDPAVWPYKIGPAGWGWHDEIGWSFMQVSELCDFDFWAGELWTHDGRAILNLVKTFGDVTLLTTPMPNIASASGKMAWIERELPELKRHVLITTELKAVLAQVPDSVLIDDCQKTVVEWRAAGGKAVLVPRHWNELHEAAYYALILMRRQLEGIWQGY